MASWCRPSRQALAALAGAAAERRRRAVGAGRQSVDLQVADQALRLAPNEVLVEAGSPQGYAVAEGTACWWR